MPTTFIDLTNTLLRRVNEVEINPSDFAGVRGIQALAKDAVRTSIARINSAEFEWPFNASEHSQTMTVGQEEYSWPQFFKTVEWNSFYIVGDDALNTKASPLKFIERDVWYSKFRKDDLDGGSAGLQKPIYVFPSHGNGYGVSPSPDKPYVVRFRYFLNYAELTASDDQTRVPTTFDHVIIDGALYNLYMFRDNTEAAGIAQQSFLMGLKEMQTLLINKYESVRDTRVAF